jgi:hypothetical protein
LQCGSLCMGEMDPDATTRLNDEPAATV